MLFFLALYLAGRIATRALGEKWSGYNSCKLCTRPGGAVGRRWAATLTTLAWRSTALPIARAAAFLRDATAALVRCHSRCDSTRDAAVLCLVVCYDQLAPAAAAAA